MSEHNWNLKEIFKNKEEFNIMKKGLEEDLEKISKYQGILCENSNNLYSCYKLFEKALEKYEKLYGYGMLYYNLDMSNQEGIKLYKEVEAIGTNFSTKTAFMIPEITYADSKEIEKYIKEDKRLEPYKRDILDILEEKEHILSKEEENILANYGEVFSAPENTFEVLTNAEFKFGNLIDENGKNQELTESNYTIYLKSKKEEVRKQAFNLMYDKYKEFINTITELYLSNVKKTAITANLRKYKSSLDMATKNDDSNLKVYETLINTINEKISINHKFIKLKKEILKKKEFHMYDLYVNPFEQGKDEITYEEAKEEVINALSIMGEEYVNKLKEAFTNNWIDVYAKPHKRGGAYSMGIYGVHPFVLLNFLNSKRDISTIAHELGHSIHSYYSNLNQNIINADYTLMTAEVASTVNEILLSNYQIENEKDIEKKKELLYELLEMIRTTLFRQSMFAEFEKIIHEKVENGENLSCEDLNKIYYDLNKKYFGDNIIVDEKIQFEWARIPHFYSDFYVYKYATGISSAISIANKIVKQRTPYIEKYINILKQGRSKKSIDLLKMVDVDLETKEVYEEAINFYNEKIKELEKLI